MIYEEYDEVTKQFVPGKVILLDKAGFESEENDNFDDPWQSIEMPKGTTIIIISDADELDFSNRLTFEKDGEILSITGELTTDQYLYAVEDGIYCCFAGEPIDLTFDYKNGYYSSDMLTEELANELSKYSPDYVLTQA